MSFLDGTLRIEACIGAVYTSPMPPAPAVTGLRKIRDGANRKAQFFSRAVQLTTTVSGVLRASVRGAATMKRWPSAVTSYP